ncbi:MAG: galactokinase [Armatimonadota bacterium]
MSDIEKRAKNLVNKFIELYGVPPQVIVKAPGRVNLIGEHTDYNDGYVLPIAIDRETLIAASPSSDSTVCLYSANLDRTSVFSLDKIVHDRANKWSNYPRGVAWMLRKKKIPIEGVNMTIDGDVPMGAGLSSSASLEVAAAFAWQQLCGFEMSGADMALLCQKAENDFAGVKCGIMDQFISRLGQKNHALFIDCRTLDYQAVPLPDAGIKLIIADTLKKRGLVDSEYNNRRAQCEEAVTLFKSHIPNITALRDISVADFGRYGTELPPTVRRRAEHVVHEDARVLKSVDALKKGDIKKFGKLMNESHESLRDLYEVSCRELDAMVEAAWRIPGVYGSRMTGAGFGGCTVSLVADNSVEDFLKRVPEDYRARIGVMPEMYVCTPENGAEVIKHEIPDVIEE